MWNKERLLHKRTALPAKPGDTIINEGLRPLVVIPKRSVILGALPEVSFSANFIS
jgi:hypothetical protein